MMFGKVSLAAKSSYYENFYQIVDVDQLLLKSLPHIRDFTKTACPIQILNVPFGVTPAGLAGLLGAPKFKRIETDHSSLSTTTFFYRKPFFSGKAILQFNFLNDQFISCVVTFVEQKNSGEQLFLNIIKEKYLLPPDKSPPDKPPSDKALNTFEGITDTKGNLLLYEESVYSSLVYVNAARVNKNIQHEVDEKLKMVNLLHWKKHYQNWSDNL